MLVTGDNYTCAIDKDSLRAYCWDRATLCRSALEIDKDGRMMSES
jgi:hypothetical protein